MKADLFRGGDWAAADGISAGDPPPCEKCERPLDEEDLRLGRTAHEACNDAN